MIGFLNGELGDPPGGWPEPFRTKALVGPHPRGASRRAHRRAATRRCRGLTEPASTLNALLFPDPPRTSPSPGRRTATLSVLPTRDYLYGLRPGEEHEVAIEEGKTLLLGVASVSAPDERGSAP